jgi:hypothetical protein
MFYEGNAVDRSQQGESVCNLADTVNTLMEGPKTLDMGIQCFIPKSLYPSLCVTHEICNLN